MLNLQKISPENAHQLQEIGSLGRGTIREIHWLSTNDKFMVVSTESCWIHDRDKPDQSSKLIDFMGGEVTASALSSQDVLAVAVNGLWINPANVHPYHKTAEIRLYDAQNGNLIIRLQHQPHKILLLEFSPSGKYLVSSDMVTTIIWNIEQKKAFISIPRAVHAVAFNEDETEMAFIMARRWHVPRHAYVLNMATAELTHYPDATLDGQHRAGITHTPDGFVVASVFKSQDGTVPHQVMMSNLSSGQSKIVVHIPQQWPWIEKVLFSGDGSCLATYITDQALIVLDTATFSRICVIHSPNHIYDLRLSSDGTYLVGVSSQNVVYVWDAITGKLQTSLKENVTSSLKVNISPDSQQILGWDGPMYIWDRPSGKLTSKHYDNPDVIFDFAITPSGKLLTGHLKGAMILHNLDSGTQQALSPDHPFGVQSVAISPNGRLIAAGGTLGSITIWDAETLQQIVVLKGEPGCKNYIYGLAFHPNGQWLASGDQYGKLRLWDTTTFEQISVFTDYHGRSRLEFSPNGHYLLSATSDYNRLPTYKEQTVSRARLWSVPDLAIVHAFDFPDMINPKAVFSANGHLLAIVVVPEHHRSYPSKEIVRMPVTIHIIDANTFEELYTLEHLPERESGSFDVAFSSDGSLLFYEDGYDFVVWDLATREKKVVLVGNREVYGLKVNPQTTLIVGRNFSTIKLWGIPQ